MQQHHMTGILFLKILKRTASKLNSGVVFEL